MKKEIKATKSGNQLVVLHKLSLSMSIINYVAIALIIVGLVMAALIPKDDPELNNIASSIAVCGVGIGMLSSFLSIGEFILNKKVTKISDKLTPKTSTIVFAVFFALVLLSVVILGIFFALSKRFEYDAAAQKTMIWVVIAAIVYVIGLIGQTIMSTIVMVKTKTKKAK